MRLSSSTPCLRAGNGQRATGRSSLCQGAPVDFYAIAAQVIPVLLFALVFESRALAAPPATYDAKADPDDPARWNISQAIVRWYALAILGVGEVVALIVTNVGRDDALVRSVVWGSMLVGMYGVLAPLLARQWEYIQRWRAASTAGDGSRTFQVLVWGCVLGLSAGWIAVFCTIASLH